MTRHFGWLKTPFWRKREAGRMRSEESGVGLAARGPGCGAWCPQGPCHSSPPRRQPVAAAPDTGPGSQQEDFISASCSSFVFWDFALVFIWLVWVWLKPWKCTVSRFWRPQARGQGVGRSVPPRPMKGCWFQGLPLPSGALLVSPLSSAGLDTRHPALCLVCICVQISTCYKVTICTG